MLHVEVTDESLMDFVEMQRIGFVQQKSQQGTKTVIRKKDSLSRMAYDDNRRPLTKEKTELHAS